MKQQTTHLVFRTSHKFEDHVTQILYVDIGAGWECQSAVRRETVVRFRSRRLAAGPGNLAESEQTDVQSVADAIGVVILLHLKFPDQRLLHVGQSLLLQLDHLVPLGELAFQIDGRRLQFGDSNGVFDVVVRRHFQQLYLSESED